MNSEKILTKLCYKLIEGDYLDKNGKVKDVLKFKISIPELGIINSKIPAKEDEKFDTYLFLPEGEDRKGEGGLRTRGYFKFNYIRNKEDNRWWISDFRGNPQIPAPEEIQQQINSYMAENKDLNVLNIEQLPLITVITVVLNGEKYLEETIQSVINQTYPNVEYIIIDGGSTDGTLDIIKKYENYIDYWVSEKDKGIYDAMNKGVRLSMGGFLCFIGSDDILDSSWINKAICSHYNKEANYIYGNINFISSFGEIYFKYRNINKENLKKSFLIPHSGSIQRRDLFKETLFDETFKIIGDYDFVLCVLDKLSLLYIDYTQIHMRLGGASNSYKLLSEQLRELYKIEAKHNIKLSQRCKFKLYIKKFLSYNGYLYSYLQHLFWKAKVIQNILKKRIKEI